MQGCPLQSAWNLNGTIVIIASNSGSTYSCLAVSNLLQAFTQKIFVISSEFDTQVHCFIPSQSQSYFDRNPWTLLKRCYFISDSTADATDEQVLWQWFCCQRSLIYVFNKRGNSICRALHYRSCSIAPNFDSNSAVFNEAGHLRR